MNEPKEIASGMKLEGTKNWIYWKEAILQKLKDQGLDYVLDLPRPYDPRSLNREVAKLCFDRWWKDNGGRFEEQGEDEKMWRWRTEATLKYGHHQALDQKALMLVHDACNAYYRDIVPENYTAQAAWSALRTQFRRIEEEQRNLICNSSMIAACAALQSFKMGPEEHLSAFLERWKHLEYRIPETHISDCFKCIAFHNGLDKQRHQNLADELMKMKFTRHKFELCVSQALRDESDDSSGNQQQMEQEMISGDDRPRKRRRRFGRVASMQEESRESTTTAKTTVGDRSLFLSSGVKEEPTTE